MIDTFPKRRYIYVNIEKTPPPPKASGYGGTCGPLSLSNIVLGPKRPIAGPKHCQVRKGRKPLTLYKL